MDRGRHSCKSLSLLSGNVLGSKGDCGSWRALRTCPLLGTNGTDMSLQVHVAVSPATGPLKQVPNPAAFLSRSPLLPRCPFSCVRLCSKLDMEKDPAVFCRLGLEHHHTQLINSSAGTVKLQEGEGRGEQEPLT